MTKPVETEDLIVIRPLATEDAAAAAQLSDQLGYPSSEEVLRGRILQLSSDPSRIALAAEHNGELVGWVDAAIERHLQGRDAVVLGGLVVRENMRGHGIGKKLCLAIEEWTQKKGIAVLRVRSQIKRTDAHRFYLRDGYSQVKTSVVFEKALK